MLYTALTSKQFFIAFKSILMDVVELTVNSVTFAYLRTKCWMLWVQCTSFDACHQSRDVFVYVWFVCWYVRRSSFFL